MSDEQTRGMELWVKARLAALEAANPQWGLPSDPDQAAASVIASALAERDEEIKALREALVDDPDCVAAGIPEAAIEAGTEALDSIQHDLTNYVSGVTPDWDEGMIVAAVFKAVARSILTKGARHE